MTKKSLRDFDPIMVAELETQMWKAYYGHNFLKLFVLLMRLMRDFFGVNIFQTIRASYYSTKAAMDFRLNKGHENRERVRRSLTKFFQVIARGSIEQFDAHKAAELETAWWFIDRYPERYEISREAALADAMSVLYGLSASVLSEYALYRSKAMTLQDTFENPGVVPDWNEVSRLLRKSFVALKTAVS